MNYTIAKQVLYSVAAFLVGYGLCSIAEGHTNSVVFSWMALIQGLAACGLYHGGLAQENPWKNGNGAR